ncbi:Protein CANDIDATE G-PROTEIN COUPLED REPTOR 7 [Ranunculus cassubicifolius]
MVSRLSSSVKLVCFFSIKIKYLVFSLASILILAGVPEILNCVRDQPPSTLLFTVIVLIGTGWSFLKPFLQEREKKVLRIVIPLQVITNVASVVIGETGPFIRDWVTWNQVFLLIDIVCCCAIIFPIVWSIRSLRETTKTRIVVFALRTISAYKYQCVSNAAEEIASLAFYLKNVYFVIDEEDEESAKQILQDEEFEL